MFRSNPVRSDVYKRQDLTELGNLIELAESIDTSEFTSETVEAFQAALEAAQEVYDDGNDALAVDVEKADVYKRQAYALHWCPAFNQWSPCSV